MSEREFFLKRYEEFEKESNFVPRILRSIPRVDRKPNPRRTWANLLFARLGTIANSLLRLCHPEVHNPENAFMLDASSIASLARNLLEAWAMFAYVSDLAISDDEWQLRRMVLELHDITARYRLYKDIGDTEEAKKYRPKIGSLKTAIESNPLFQDLDPERKEKVLRGQELYLKGLRGLAKEAGWDIDHFNAMYNVLSSHAHSAPMSFYRAAIDPAEPALGIAPHQQYAIAGAALEYATGALAFACKRMFETYPETFLTGESRH